MPRNTDSVPTTACTTMPGYTCSNARLTTPSTIPCKAAYAMMSGGFVMRRKEITNTSTRPAIDAPNAASPDAPSLRMNAHDSAAVTTTTATSATVRVTTSSSVMTRPGPRTSITGGWPYGPYADGPYPACGAIPPG